MKTATLSLVLMALLCASGCTGQQLAPGGTADIKFTFDAATGKVTGATVSTNRDSTIGLLEFNIQTGAFKMTKYSGNGSSLAAIQAQAMIEQFKSYQATAAEAFRLVGTVAPLFTQVPVAPSTAPPAATPDK